jgi:hypothetical protein
LSACRPNPDLRQESAFVRDIPWPMLAAADNYASFTPPTIASFSAHAKRCVAESLSCSLSLSVGSTIRSNETCSKCEAAEHIDASVPRQLADRLDHRDRLVLLSRGQHGRHILKVHQDDVGLNKVARDPFSD